MNGAEEQCNRCRHNSDHYYCPAWKHIKDESGTLLGYKYEPNKSEECGRYETKQKGDEDK